MGQPRRRTHRVHALEHDDRVAFDSAVAEWEGDGPASTATGATRERRRLDGPEPITATEFDGTPDWNAVPVQTSTLVFLGVET